MTKEKPIDFNKQFDVIGCFVEHDGKFLLLCRHPHKANGGKWGLPAGKMDTDESAIQAVLRETQEETGLAFLKNQSNFLIRYTLETEVLILNGTCLLQN